MLYAKALHFTLWQGRGAISEQSRHGSAAPNKTCLQGQNRLAKTDWLTFQGSLDTAGRVIAGRFARNVAGAGAGAGTELIMGAGAGAGEWWW